MNHSLFRCIIGSDSGAIDREIMRKISGNEMDIHPRMMEWISLGIKKITALSLLKLKLF